MLQEVPVPAVPERRHAGGHGAAGPGGEEKEEAGKAWEEGLFGGGGNSYCRQIWQSLAYN